MANPFRDVAAGALDLAGTPLDIAGLGAGVLTGTASFLAGDGFWNGFQDNPFTQTMQDYHEGITDLTGAADDSVTRRLVGSADMIIGSGVGKTLMSNVAKKQMAKKAFAQGRNAVADRLQKSIVNNSFGNVLKENLKPTNLAKNIGGYAVADTAFGLLTPGESNGTDRVMQGIAAMYLGKKGYDAIKSVSKINNLKDYRTRTDLARLTDEEKKKYVLEDFLDKFDTYKSRRNLVDEKGATAYLGKMLNILSEKAVIDLSLSARDRVNVLPIVNTIKEEAERFNAKNMTPKQIKLEHQFATLNAELGNRKNTLLNFLINNDMIDPMDYARLNNADMYEACKELAQKYPDMVKGMPNINLKQMVDQFAILRKEVGRDYFLTPGMKQIDEYVLKRCLDEGLINQAQYKKYLDKMRRGEYVPMTTDKKRTDKTSVYKKPNPFEDERSEMFFDENGNLVVEGVYHPKNTIKLFFNKMYNELEAAEQNYIKRNLIQVLEKNIPPVANKFDTQINMLKKEKDTKSVRRLQQIKEDYCYIYNTDVDTYKNLTPSERKRLERMHRVEYWVDGKKNSKYVSNDWKSLLEARNPNPSILNQVISKVNRVFTSTISGKWNPLFLVKRIMYGLGESVPAVVTEFKKAGIDISAKDVAYQFYKELKEQSSSELSKVFADAIEDETFTGKMFKGNKQEAYNWFKSKIVEPLDSGHYFMENDVVGDAIRNSNASITINGMVSDMDSILTSAKYYWNNFNELFGVKILDALKSGVDNAQQNTVLRLIKDNFSDLDEQRKMMIKISQKMSDTRRRGGGFSLGGKITNAIQDFMPYGASSLQGLVGKMEYLPKNLMKDSKRYLSKAWEVNEHNLVDTAGDVMWKIGSQLAKLPDNVVFDVLWKTVGIPTAVCYLWNNMNNDQSSSYHSLKDYEKANKFLLTNFAGPGINIAIPMDQEWSVLKNVFEVMLDSVFGLSQMDEGNPAFSYKTQLAWSIGQDLGISLPVPAEVLINMTGYKTNLDPTAPFTEDNMIEAINKYRYKRLNPEFATVVQTLTGKLGKILVNMAEGRDVMDYRYALPFLQLGPHKDMTSDTVSFLNQQLKMNPTPELKSWEYQRRKLKEERKFYDINGCTKKGEVLGSREKVLREYDKQIQELDANTYRQAI